MGFIRKDPAANVADNAALLLLNSKVTEHVIKRMSSRTEVRVDDSRILGSVSRDMWGPVRAYMHAYVLCIRPFSNQLAESRTRRSTRTSRSGIRGRECIALPCGNRDDYESPGVSAICKNRVCVPRQRHI